MPISTITLSANVAERVLEANPLRKTYTIKNDSTSNIYLGHDSGVATSGGRQGLLIPAAGGNLEDEHWKGEVWLIAPANVSITVSEDLETPEERKYKEAKKEEK